MTDSGNIFLEISIPSIGATFNSEGKNFYSRQEGQIDYANDTERVVEEATKTMERIDSISEKISSSKLDKAKEKLELALSLEEAEQESEITQEAMENVLESRKLIAQTIKENQKPIRQMDFDSCIEFFDGYVREYAKPSEVNMFNNLSKTAQRSIDNSSNDFENQLDGLKQMNFDILWRQDWFVVDRFKTMVESPHHYTDKAMFNTLRTKGFSYIESDNISELKNIVGLLYQNRYVQSMGENMNDIVNIVKG